MDVSRVHVFVVGLPASGKTTVCGLLRERLPRFDYASDLEALHQLADLTEAKCQSSSLAPVTAGTDAAGANRCDQPLPSNLAVTRDNEGRLKFDHPEVWDEALRRAYRSVEASNQLLFEFSRGSDERYKRHFRIDDRSVYARSFGVLAGCSSSPAMRLVVHLECPPAIARDRNRHRRAGGHALSSEAMGSSYTYDPLLCEGATCPDGVIVESGAPWPMLSLASARLTPEDICREVTAWIGGHA